VDVRVPQNVGESVQLPPVCVERSRAAAAPRKIAEIQIDGLADP
jgi:hypothetical protein